MKLKNTIFIFAILFLFLLCISGASALEDNTTLSVDDEDTLQIEDNMEPIMENESSSDNAEANQTASDETNGTDANENSNQTNTTPTKTVSKKTLEAFCSNGFVKKSNKYYTVKVFTQNEKTYKFTFYKNVKITVKIKIGSKTKTFNVKTNSKGEAKVLNIKNLKGGTYGVAVTSNDSRYKINEKGTLSIYTNNKKSVTLKMNARKKIKNDYIETLYFSKNQQYPKGVYTTDYDAKHPRDKVSHIFILKAKFFFKNKKTGKIITKTVNTKKHSLYGWTTPQHKLISGYTPIKATIWYARS